MLGATEEIGEYVAVSSCCWYCHKGEDSNSRIFREESSWFQIPAVELSSGNLEERMDDEKEQELERGCWGGLLEIKGPKFTWMVVETIYYFSRNGSEVFTSAMDLTKAFDNVKHKILFTKRCTCNIHTAFDGDVFESNCQCQMDGSLSYTFAMKNGVKHAAVLSALLYYCVRGRTL